MIARPVVLGVALILAALSRPAVALSQDIGDISCDVFSGYVATGTAYVDVFRSYVEGYLAGEKDAGKSPSADRDVTMLMSQVIEVCSSSRDAPLAVAANPSRLVG